MACKPTHKGTRYDSLADIYQAKTSPQQIIEIEKLYSKYLDTVAVFNPEQLKNLDSEKNKQGFNKFLNDFVISQFTSSKTPAELSLKEKLSAIIQKLYPKVKLNFASEEIEDATEKDSFSKSNNNQSLQEGLDWLKSVNPNVQPKIIQGLIDGIANGSYDSNLDLITLSEEFANKKTVKHEFLHKILASLPFEQREAILDEASKKYGIARGESKTTTTKYQLSSKNQNNRLIEVYKKLFNVKNVHFDLSKVPLYIAKLLTKKELKDDSFIFNLVEKHNLGNDPFYVDISKAKTVEDLEKMYESKVQDIFNNYALVEAKIPNGRIRNQLMQLQSTQPQTAILILQKYNIKYKEDVLDYTDVELELIKKDIESEVTKTRKLVGEKWKEILKPLKGSRQYLVAKALYQYIVKDRENYPIGYLKEPFDATLQKFEKSSNPTAFNFYNEYNNEIINYLGEDKDAVVKIETDSGISGTWIKMNKASESKNVGETKIKVAAASNGTGWCTKYTDSRGTGAMKVIEEDDHDFYVFFPKGTTQATIAIVPIKEGEESQLESNRWYTGVFKKNNASDNSIEPEYYDALNQLAKKTKDNDLIHTLEQIGYSGLTKEELKALKRKKEQEKYDFLENHTTDNFNSEEDRILVNRIFGFDIQPNGESFKIHEMTAGMINQIPEDIRKEFLDKLFQTINLIEGEAHFTNSQVTSLGNLQSIGGNASLNDSEVTSLGNLQSIGGGASFNNSKITSLDNLQSIGGTAYFRADKITSLGNLQSIGGGAYFDHSKITSLGNLQSIGGTAYFRAAKITSLGNLQSIGGGAAFNNSKITSLGNLQSIGESVSFIDSEVTSLGNLQSIGGNTYFNHSQHNATLLQTIKTKDINAKIEAFKIHEKLIEKITNELKIDLKVNLPEIYDIEIIMVNNHDGTFSKNYNLIEDPYSFFKDKEGNIYGATYKDNNGVQQIYINEKYFNNEVLLHEAYHPFDDLMQNAANRGDKKAKAAISRLNQLAKEGGYLDIVKRDYPELDEIGALAEARVRMIGEIGDKMMDKTFYEKLKNALLDAINWVADYFNVSLKDYTEDEILNLKLEDIVKASIGSSIKNEFNETEYQLSKEQSDAIDNVFESNPELANAVTKEQYRDYVNSLLTGETISNQAGDLSKSQVKDIVYQGKTGLQTNQKSKELGIFFTDDKNASNIYAVKYKGDEFDDSIIQRIVNKFGLNPTIEQIKSEIDFFEKMGATKEQIEKDAKEFQSYISNNKGIIVQAIVNIKNPKNLTVKEWFDNYHNSSKLKENSDGLLLKGGKQSDNRIYDGGENQIVVFEPEQIHILGSKQDIEQAKEFVSRQNVKYPQAQQNEINYALKAVDILQSAKGDEIFRKGDKNKWSIDDILLKLEIPKEQKELIKSFNTRNREEIITNLLANYSYSIEINTAKKEYSKNYTRGNQTPTEDRPYGNNTFEINNVEYSSNIMDGGYKKYENGKYYNITAEEYKKAFDSFEKTYETIPTSYYSNLTVPGGTNYTENEIATPDITPNIKGHAQFATDNGIGWFRSDDKGIENVNLGNDIDYDDLVEYQGKNYKVLDYSGKTDRILHLEGNLKVNENEVKLVKKYSDLEKEPKTRRILEVQSDLFQKGRDKQNFISESNEKISLKNINDAISNPEKYWTEDMGGGYWLADYESVEQGFDITGSTKEQFLERLKSKKLELEKSAVSKENQFLQLLNKDNNWVTFFVKSIIQDSTKKGYEKILFPSGKTVEKIEGFNRITEEIEKFDKDIEWINNQTDEIVIIEKYPYTNREDKTNKIGIEATKDLRIQKINKDKQHYLDAQKDTLSTINFYENTVTNILNKTYGKDNVKLITDEYGNTWNEVDLSSEKVKQQTGKILFQSPKLQYTGDLAIEEKIAEEAENSKDETVAKTPLQKFIQSIKNLLRNIFKEKDKISRLLRDMNQGRLNNINKNNSQYLKQNPNDSIEEVERWTKEFNKNVLNSVIESKEIIDTKKQIEDLRDEEGYIPFNKIKEFRYLSKKLFFLQSSPIQQIKKAMADFYDKNNLTEEQKRQLITLIKINDSFSEAIQALEDFNSVEFVKSEFMDIVDSNNESIKKIINEDTEATNIATNKKSEIAAKELGIELYKEYLSNELDDFIQKHSNQQVKFIWNLIKKVTEKLGVKTRFSLEGNTTVPTGVAGVYSQGKIDIKASLLQDPETVTRIIVHELVHGATNYIIDAVRHNKTDVLKLLTQKQVNAVKKLSNLLKQLQSDVNTKDHYGSLNEDEILAELTEEGFVEALKNKKLNFLERLLDYILEILGVETDAYKEALQILEELIENPVLYIEEGFVNVNALYSKQDQPSLSNFIKQKSQEKLKATQEGFNTNSELTKIPNDSSLTAKTALIEAVKESLDTLPHEHARHYIAMFINTPIVQEAIKKWGSEEALVQSIKEQAIIQEGKAWGWWNKFVKWILNQNNKLSALQKKELTKILTDAFLTTKNLNGPFSEEPVNEWDYSKDTPRFYEGNIAKDFGTSRELLVARTALTNIISDIIGNVIEKVVDEEGNEVMKLMEGKLPIINNWLLVNKITDIIREKTAIDSALTNNEGMVILKRLLLGDKTNFNAFENLLKVIIPDFALPKNFESEFKNLEQFGEETDLSVSDSENTTAYQITSKDRIDHERRSTSNLKIFLSTLVYKVGKHSYPLSPRFVYYKMLQLTSGLDINNMKNLEKIKEALDRRIMQEGNNNFTKVIAQRFFEIVKSAATLDNNLTVQFLNTSKAIVFSKEFREYIDELSEKLSQEEFDVILNDILDRRMINGRLKTETELFLDNYFYIEKNKKIPIFIVYKRLTSPEKFLTAIANNLFYEDEADKILPLYVSAINRNLLAEIHDTFISQREKEFKTLILNRVAGGFLESNYADSISLGIKQATKSRILNDISNDEFRENLLKDRAAFLGGRDTFEDKLTKLNRGKGKILTHLQRIAETMDKPKEKTFSAAFKEAVKTDAQLIKEFPEFAYLDLDYLKSEDTDRYVPITKDSILILWKISFDDMVAAKISSLFGIDKPSFYDIDMGKFVKFSFNVLEAIKNYSPELFAVRNLSSNRTEKETTQLKNSDTINLTEAEELPPISFASLLLKHHSSDLNRIAETAVKDNDYARATTIKAADGLPRYLFSPSSAALNNAIALRDINETMNLPAHFKLPFYAANPLLDGDSRGYYRFIHRVVDHDSQRYGDKVTEYKKETNRQYWEREFIGGFLSSLYEGKQTYIEFINPIEDRPTTIGLEFFLYNSLELLNRYQGMLKQLTKRPESNISFYNRKSLINLGILKDLLKAKDNEDVLKHLTGLSDVTFLMEALKKYDSNPNKFEEVSPPQYKAIAEAMMNSMKWVAEKIVEDMLLSKVQLPINFHKLADYIKFEIDSEFANMIINGIAEDYSSKTELRFKIPYVFGTPFDFEKNKDLVRALTAVVHYWQKHSYINNYLAQQLIAGDVAAFKSSFARIKRLGGATAPGFVGSHNKLFQGEEKTRALVIEDLSELLGKDSSLREAFKEIYGEEEKGDLNDAAAIMLPERLEMLQRAHGEGKNLGGIVKSASYTITADGPDMLKSASTVLTNSFLASGDEFNHRKKLKTLVDNMRKLRVMEAYPQSAKKILGLPAVSLETLMSRKLSDEEIEKFEESVFEIDNNNFRIQFNPVHLEEEAVTNFSQLPYFTNIMTETREEADQIFDAQAKLYELGLDEAKERFATPEDIRNEIIKATKGNNANEFTSLIEKGIDLNFPLVLNRALSYLATSFSKIAIQFKFSGGKMVLVSSVGVTNQKTGERLKPRIDRNGNFYYEAILPRYMEKYVHLGDLIGVRIPTTEIHSASPLKVVGYYDNDGTNGIIIPFELIKITGADFDVDSMFVIRSEESSKKYLLLYHLSQSWGFYKEDKLFELLPIIKKLQNVEIAYNNTKKKNQPLMNVFDNTDLTEDKFSKEVLDKRAEIIDELENSGIFYDYKQVEEFLMDFYTRYKSDLNEKAGISKDQKGIESFNKIEYENLLESYEDAEGETKKIYREQLKAVLKNKVVLNYLKALQGEKTRKRMLSPVSMAMFNKKSTTFKENGLYAEGTVNRFLQDMLLKKQGLTLSSPNEAIKEAVKLQEEFDLSNLYSKSQAYATVFAGSDLTGIFANFTKALAYSIKNGIRVYSETMDIGYSVEKEQVKKLSKLIEIETEALKELQAAGINATKGVQLAYLRANSEVNGFLFNYSIKITTETPTLTRTIFNTASPSVDLTPTYIRPVRWDGKDLGSMQDILKTWEILDGSVNAAIDNINEQILPIMNINQTTAEAYAGAVAMGMDVIDLALFFNQSVIKLLKYERIEDIKKRLEKEYKNDGKDLDKLKNILNFKAVAPLGFQELNRESLIENYGEKGSLEHNLKILYLFEKFKESGHLIGELSFAIFPLKEVASDFPSLLRVEKAWKTYFEQAKDITTQRTSNIAHIENMKKSMNFLMGVIRETIFIHGQFSADLEEALTDFGNPKLNSFSAEENLQLLKEQFLKFSLTYLTPETYQKENSTIEEPLEIEITWKSNKGRTLSKIITGPQAYVYKVGEELLLILSDYGKAKKWHLENNEFFRKNEFLEGLSVEVSNFGFMFIRYTLGANKTDVDFYMLKEDIKEIPTGWTIDPVTKAGSFNSTVSSESLKTKLVYLGMLSNGLSAGQNTYNKALNDSDLVDVSLALRDILYNTENDSKGEIIKFLIQTAAMNNSTLPYVAKAQATLISTVQGDKNIYEGRIRIPSEEGENSVDVFYDMHLKADEKVTALPHLIQSGNYDTPYIMVYNDESDWYYRKLNAIRNYQAEPTEAYSVKEFFRTDIPYFNVDNFQVNGDNVTFKADDKTNLKINSMEQGFFITKKAVPDNSDRIYVTKTIYGFKQSDYLLYEDSGKEQFIDATIKNLTDKKLINENLEVLNKNKVKMYLIKINAKLKAIGNVEDIFSIEEDKVKINKSMLNYVFSLLTPNSLIKEVENAEEIKEILEDDLPNNC